MQLFFNGYNRLGATAKAKPFDIRGNLFVNACVGWLGGPGGHSPIADAQKIKQSGGLVNPYFTVSEEMVNR